MTLQSGDAATALNTYLSSFSDFNGQIIEIQINSGATLNEITLQPGRKLAQLLKYGEYAVISFIGWTDNAHTLFIKSNGVWRIEYPILRREFDALNSRSTTVSAEIVPNTEVIASNHGIWLRKYGNIVSINGFCELKNAVASNVTIFTIPEGYRPAIPVRAMCGNGANAYSPDDIAYIGIISSGAVSVTTKSNNTKKVLYMNITFAVN